MDWKQADAIRLAYQRCAWQLQDAGHASIAVEEMQKRADEYKDLADRVWQEANGRG